MNRGAMAGGESVQRAMEILELLAGEPRGRTLPVIADHLGLTEPAAKRLLETLTRTGYVGVDMFTDAYFTTLKLGALGLRRLESIGIDQWAQPTLDRLAEKTHELVRLAILGDFRLHWIAKAQGSNSRLTLDPTSGTDAVPHATASGKAWLATLAPAEVAALLEQTGLPAQTEHTITELPRLQHELAVARERGYALGQEEKDVGVNAIAAPIRGDGAKGAAVGTVSVAGPAVRLTSASLIGLVPDLLAAADELGASWSSYGHLTHR
jgi:IclR family acetate operon transcriptional repressor